MDLLLIKDLVLFFGGIALVINSIMMFTRK